MIAPASLIYPEEAGAVGDGLADDTRAMTAAFEAAAEYDGPSVVWLTPGRTYRTTGGGVQASGVGGDVTFTGGGTWKSEGSYGLRVSTGANDAYPAYLIGAADKDDTTVTTIDAHTLAVGDWVAVYTGMTTTVVSGDSYPADGEMNRVLSVNGTTIGLLWPLAKDYRQEFYEPGQGLGTGTTSTTNSGDPAPMAVRKINVFDGLGFDGITIEHSGASAFVAGHRLANLHIDNVTATARALFMSVSAMTGGMSNCAIHCQESPGWWFTCAYWARDVVAEDCTFTSDVLGYIHVHEGASDVTLRNLTIVNASGQDLGDVAIIGLRGRAYDVGIVDVSVENSSIGDGGAGLRVDTGVTGSATGYTFTGTGTDVVNNSGGTFTVNGV